MYTTSIWYQSEVLDGRECEWHSRDDCPKLTKLLRLGDQNGRSSDSGTQGEVVQCHARGQDSLHENHTYELMELPDGKKALRYEWVYTN